MTARDEFRAEGTPPPPPPEFEGEPALPGYSARQEFTEQEYSLEDGKGRPWMWLKVKSRSRGDKQLPLFYDRDTISGHIKVDFDKAVMVKAVTISVLAGVTAVGQDEVKFLEIRNELWNAGSSSSKPSGKQSWPYKIKLPAEATVIERGKKQQQTEETFPLPPSFSERASPAYIDYRLVVTVKRSSFRVNKTFTTTFGYTPRTLAEPPSALRQLAYREGSPLVGPQGDPEGWKILAPVKVVGVVFDTRKVELECTLAVAVPLTYALGSPIPIVLTLKSDDEQALDLLSTPSAVRLNLLRTRLVGSHATSGDVESGRSNNSFTNNAGGAFFWPSDEGAPESGTRVLQGELEVKRSLRPGFVFPRFSVQYVLALSQFEAPGFAPASKEPLVHLPVTIASSNAAGVVPRSYAPPGYVERHEGDYMTTMGYLENGNQRFLHHHGFG
ncbi:hypothetical protein C8Q74DRAFT_1252361 [Fomes fomentarius]|nr:hypothetical protein C8Q74DRAFT_1252361 [Fomes fomentarius]